MTDKPPGGLWFQAAHRNREPIGEVLREVLPAEGTVVEIAAGGGQHAAYFSGLFPHLRWQPTEPQADRRDSIEAWRAHTGHPNFLAPLALDVEGPWPIARADAIYLANLLHVSPRTASTALLRGAARVLVPGAPLCVYGPFTRNGAFTTPSNAEFDQTVKGWHPSYGIRDLEELAAEAVDYGLHLDEVRDMPANNFLVVWRRR
ncbi:MAG: DUF938 domain-containing protein [Deltaproteobacteria bacterium]|nr:MAG: DUF938 domain-containing protein [Deltaproteobacteria bacterium]